MGKGEFVTVAGCVLKEKKTGLPDYSTLFCPECKKRSHLTAISIFVLCAGTVRAKTELTVR